MTITRAGIAGVTFGDGTTSVARSVGSVTAGQMVVAKVGYLDLAAAGDLPVAGDLTKTAGTATIDTPQLDSVEGGQIGNGPEFLYVATYSMLVTGSGTLTLTFAGAQAGSFLSLASEAYNGSWDASRVEAVAAGGFSATDNSSTADAGNMTSAGAALFIGAFAANNGVAITITPDSPWNTLAVDGTSAHVITSFVDQIVSVGTTDSPGWSWTPALDGGTYAGTAYGGVVYKEAGGGGGPTIASADDTTPASGQSVTITVTGAGASQGASTLKWGGADQTCTAWADTSITFTANPPASLKNGVSADLVLRVSSVDSSPFALTLNPPAGYSYVDLTSIAGTGLLEASPALQVGWQVEIQDPAVAYADGTWSTPVLLRSFQFRVHDGTSFGALQTQTISPNYIPSAQRMYNGTAWIKRDPMVYAGGVWGRRKVIPQ